MRKLLLILAAVALAATAPQRASAADPNAERAVREAIELFARGDLEAAASLFAPEATSELSPEALSGIHGLLAVGNPTTLGVVDHFPVGTPQQPAESIVLHLRGPQSARLVYATVQQRGPSQIIGFYVQPADLDPAAQFTLRKRSASQYLALAAAIAVPLFILVTVGVCFFAKPARRWRWMLFILVGFGSIDTSWIDPITGPTPVSFRPMRVQFLGAGALKRRPYEPWILSFSIPLGASLFWFRRSESRRTGGGEAADIGA